MDFLFRTNAFGQPDLVRTDSELVLDLEGLETAVFISLFTDRRAGPDEELPDESYRGGWFGDGIDDDGFQLGSRLFLLRRAKNTPETVRRARFYAVEALEWLKDDGHVLDVRAEARARGEWLDIDIELDLPAGTSRSFAFRYRPATGEALVA